MRSLELNLASRPFRNNTLLWVGYALLAVAVVSFTAWNTVTYVDTHRTLDQLRNTVGSVESRINSVDQRERNVEARITKHDVKNLATRTTRANEFIQRKAFSWTGLFNVLEHVQPYEVKMSSVRPIFGGEGGSAASLASQAGSSSGAVPVSVDGVCKTIQAFFEFEDRLIADPHIDRLEPSRTNRAKNGEILFTLSFLYYPEGLEKKSGPEQAAVHDATVLKDDAGDTDEAGETDKASEAEQGAPGNDAAKKPPAAGAPIAESSVKTPAPPPRAAQPAAPVAAGDDPDPRGRPLFKSGGRRPAPDKQPSDPAQKKDGQR